ncbi:MAG TPA: PQQ-binding-like beta-propeller repeat protein [Pyrinomonadaceae bacterium]|nr:PQQ-binding-like beta-propeller repeat protein [Pyrinomonadaceae bacterium]
MMLPRRPGHLHRKTLCLGLLVALSLPLCARAQTAASTPSSPAAAAAQNPVSLKLKWAAKPRARRYRLQVSLDENFTDIVFDRAVVGLEHEVTGLQPGKYYWRVAPATPETGRYTAPALVEATPLAPPVPVVPVAPVTAVMRPPTDVGWQAVIGAVARPLAARLRAGKSLDLIALNSDGAVYALDGSDGSALWSARPPVKPAGGETKDKPGGNLFTPLVLPASAESRSVVAFAFAGGVRGVDGETGRELWRTPLEGRLAGGTAAQMQGETGAAEFAVATSEPDMLYVLDGKSGGIVSRTKLSGTIIGTPIPFRHGDIQGIAYSLDNRQLDIRRRDGSIVRAIKFDVPFTTPPLVITTPRATLVVIGTAHGLIFFEGSEMKPLGRITTEKDAPRGRLTAADLDNDGVFEIVMVTKNGRVAVISATGKVNWASEGATDAYMATFAHLNNDGTLDVIAASGASFALGFSGRDGTLLWRAEENPNAQPASGDGTLRTLVGSISSTGVPLLIGGDANRSAVRAVGLPVNVGSAAVK